MNVRNLCNLCIFLLISYSNDMNVLSIIDSWIFWLTLSYSVNTHQNIIVCISTNIQNMCLAIIHSYVLYPKITLLYVNTILLLYINIILHKFNHLLKSTTFIWSSLIVTNMWMLFAITLTLLLPFSHILFYSYILSQIKNIILMIQ